MDGQIVGRIDGQTDGWIDTLMEGWMDGWMDRWIDGCMNGMIFIQPESNTGGHGLQDDLASGYRVICMM